jgi:hypothetical protein
MNNELEALRAFAQELMELWPDGAPDGAPDGGELQEIAVKHGPLTLTTPIVPCGENCGCTEFYSAGDEAECYRRTPLLDGPPHD